MQVCYVSNLLIHHLQRRAQQRGTTRNNQIKLEKKKRKKKESCLKSMYWIHKTSHLIGQVGNKCPARLLKKRKRIHTSSSIQKRFFQSQFQQVLAENRGRVEAGVTFVCCCINGFASSKTSGTKSRGA